MLHLGWAQLSSREDACNAMLQCLLLLLKLCAGDEHKCKYVRTLSLALLVWQQGNSEMPGAAYNDECNEAGLA